MFVEHKEAGEVKELDAVGKLLLKAADLIEERGHCKDQTEDGAGRLCLWGAILVAYHGRPTCMEYSGPHYDALHRLVTGMNSDLLPVAWNNAPERTGAEVIAKLRAVAFSS